MPPVQCQNCGLVVQVPSGGRRLCGCGSWLSSDEPVAVAEIAQVAPAVTEAEHWPRLEGASSAVERVNNGYRRIQKELNKAIVGQQRVLEELIIAIFARGHCLLVGVPGLAKTLMIRTLADSMNLSFSRVQFTPDLMPSDITGTEVLQDDKATGQRAFKFLHGPLFATDILEMQDIVRKVPVAPYVIRYAMKFPRLTRKDKGEVPEFIRDYVTWGAGPRATQYLVLGAKARAVLHGRYYVSCEDIRAVAAPVLRHRIITNFNAEAEGIKPDDLVRRLADLIPRDPQESVVRSP